MAHRIPYSGCSLGLTYLNMVAAYGENILTFDLQELLADYDRYVMAKSYLDLEEYDRAAHFTKTCKSPLAYFIHVYARYLAGEKRKVDDAVETTGERQIIQYEL